MLAASLWFALALALLAAVLLDGAAAFARGAVHAAAGHAVEAALHDALADYRTRLAAAIARQTAVLDTAPFAGIPPSFDAYAPAVATIPQPLQRTLPAAGTGSAGFTSVTSVTPTTLAPPSCSAGEGAGGDAIGWLQCSPLVQESRLSLRVDVEVRDVAGTVLAQRVQYLALRLFAAPPYSAIVGRKDAAAPGTADANGVSSGAHEGDAGGESLVPAARQPVVRPEGGTSIHVRYVCTDGAGACANAAPPDPDAELRRGVRWADGNRPAG